ncbi:PREDICTED: ell-associated factor Eaf-like [Diuraphis noxia]|uniref:ell-associated factor Eaf-like n=1 Tax=Diuraphis noxia TaxID=143948 RepID=UPI000763B470|nr:PREDICTED: ell-associated factor Eaf-like [Diuraphis noxia]XP_015378502.1 PREDICTED: ell-associated factor Eaf-like [Diuraphis noxia]
MLQQYQQQPDYTPYGGIGYGAQPNAGYFNYGATESSWYGSPSSGAADHAQMHACNSHIGESTGNFLNHGYHQQATLTGASTSSAESFVANSHHPVSQTDMTDPMADFLGGHQNMTENDKIIKEESIDWLSTIINDEVVDHGNRSDACADGGGGGGGVAGSGANGKLVGDLTCEGRESNGRLPNFHQAFGSTEIGRFSQHEYYEPPKDTAINECQSAGRSASAAASAAQQQQSGAGTSQQRHDEQHAVAASFEPPRQQNRRGRAQRGGGQNRRNKQTRTAAAAAAAAAAVAAQQYVGYEVTGAAVGRHQVPPYHHQDPYNRNHHHHAQQQRYHQEYHHQNQQYQNHQQDYYRSYDRMHYQQQQQQQQQPPLPSNQYYNGNDNGGGGSSSNGSSGVNNSNREQSYAGGYNRFHSCCSTEHISRPSHHHNYGPGQYYGDYNTYNQW